MKTLWKFLVLAVFALSLVVLPSDACAACITTTTFTEDGRVVICMTCCYGASCTTTCF